MELSLRLLHLPADGAERGTLGPNPASRVTAQDPQARANRQTCVTARRARDRHERPRDSARILIVGDESVAAEAVRDHLLERGHTVDLAFSADDALTAIRQVRRDVVLLDISMPEIDGVEALRRIRAVDATLPVIMVTGNAAASLERETLKLGVCGSVVKPIDFADLDRATAAALTSRSAKSDGHRDVDGPLCHASGRQLRAKRPDAGSAGLA